MPALFCPALLRHFKWLFLVCVLFCLTMEEIEVLQAFSFLYKSFAAFSSQYLEKSRYPVSCQAHWGGGWKRSRPTLGLSTPFQIDLNLNSGFVVSFIHSTNIYYVSTLCQRLFLGVELENMRLCLQTPLRLMGNRQVNNYYIKWWALEEMEAQGGKSEEGVITWIWCWGWAWLGGCWNFERVFQEKVSS